MSFWRWGRLNSPRFVSWKMMKGGRKRYPRWAFFSQISLWHRCGGLGFGDVTWNDQVQRIERILDMVVVVVVVVVGGGGGGGGVRVVDVVVVVVVAVAAVVVVVVVVVVLCWYLSVTSWNKSGNLVEMLLGIGSRVISYPTTVRDMWDLSPKE